MPRTIAIGDIHGCSVAFSALIAAIDPKPDDTIITLGDYVDRGLDSKGVLDQLIALANRCHLVPILGNHDEMMLDASYSESGFAFWTACGGISALDSYGDTGSLDQIPDSHFLFLLNCVDFFETDTHFFVHASYESNTPFTPFERMDRLALRWQNTAEKVPEPHFSGKIAIVGHTPQAEILDLGHLICIDTNCCNGGWLTALDVGNGEKWQVDEKGNLRNEGWRNRVGTDH